LHCGTIEIVAIMDSLVFEEMHYADAESLHRAVSNQQAIIGVMIAFRIVNLGPAA
jgi:hypothetical protein